LPSVHLKLKDALLIEGSDAPYANVIVVRTEDKNKPWVQDLVASMHSKSVIDRAKVDFPRGAAVVAWNNNK
jgi:D-methionine transport system substrate-binding protein